MPEIHGVDRQDVMAYLDGELPVAKAVEVAEHLEHCVECREFASGLRSLSSEAAAWKVEPVPAEVPAALVQALQQRFSKPEPPAVRKSKFRWLVPACALGAIAVTALILIRSASAPARYQMADRLSRRSQQMANTDLEVRKTVRLLERRANIALVAGNVDTARVALETVVGRHQGYVANLVVNAPADAGRSVQMMLRVPGAQLDEVLVEVKELGRVESEAVSTDEVTEQAIDLEARLANARSTEKRLNQILSDRTAKLAEVLAVEQEVSRIRLQIEQMEGEQKRLLDRVAMATIQVNVSEEAAHRQLNRSATDGLHRLAGLLTGSIEFLLGYGPSMAAVGVLLFFPARFLWKRVRRS
jgi:hypothetical protein